jgi:hypothetical protein
LQTERPPSIIFIRVCHSSHPFFSLTSYFRAYMDLILNGEKRPPSFKKLPSCLYDEPPADPRLKRSRYLCGKLLERVRFLLTLPHSYMSPGPSNFLCYFHWAVHRTRSDVTQRHEAAQRCPSEPSGCAIAYATIQVTILFTTHVTLMCSII